HLLVRTPAARGPRPPRRSGRWRPPAPSHPTRQGGIDRRVPLPAALLTLLRAYWRTHRNPVWMFPAPRRRPPRSVSDPAVGPIDPTVLQRAFGRAVRESGVVKRAHVHTLRHSYATHLLEA